MSKTISGIRIPREEPNLSFNQSEPRDVSNMLCLGKLPSTPRKHRILIWWGNDHRLAQGVTQSLNRDPGGYSTKIYVGELEQNEFFLKTKSWGFLVPLTFNYDHVTSLVTKNLKWRKLANWWRIYFVGKTNWYFWKRINIPNFLRLEWMYAKFKFEV